MSDRIPLELPVATAIELLILLVRDERELDPGLETLRADLERTLYGQLSVEEMERVTRRAEAANGR